MSWAVADKQKSTPNSQRQQVQSNGTYSKIADEENQSLSNPLISGDGKRQKQGIEQLLQQIQGKIKQLEDLHKQIGSDADNVKFRSRVQETLTETGHLLKNVSSEIKEFSDLEVSQKYMKEKRDQLSAYQVNQSNLMKKLQNLGQKIKERQVQFAHKAIQNARASLGESMTSIGEDNQGSYMVNGHAQLETKQLQLTTEELKIGAETDLLESQIQERKKEIDTIASIMQDINSIAKDIQIETAAQGEKLEKIHDNMQIADTNAEQALDQLNQAQEHNRRSGKCTYFLVGVILLCVIILGVTINSTTSSSK